MNRIFKHLLFFFFLINFFNTAYCSEYFQKGVELFNSKKYEDAKFMFERSIVFDPKNSNSYLYLAKIYNHQDDKRLEEKNLDTTLGLEKSNYSKVKDLSKTFTKICKNLCDENKKILETLTNIEPKNES